MYTFPDGFDAGKNNNKTFMAASILELFLKAVNIENSTEIFNLG